MIRKTSKGYTVLSHRTGKNLGTYDTKAGAEARLRQLRAYKRGKTAITRRGY